MLEISITDKDEEGNEHYNYANYLVVKHNGKIISYESDGMEPEDATFGRDLGWIVSLLDKVYDLGREDKENDILIEEFERRK